MKDSGIAWVGEIPDCWAVKNLPELFRERRAKNKDLQEKNLLSLSYGRIVNRDIQSNEGLLPESYEGYNIVEPGNIVLRLTDLQNDHRSLRTGLCKERGIITSAYLTIEPCIPLCAPYMHYLLHCYDECKVFYAMGDGVRQTIKFADFKKLPLLVPPMTIQRRIASFLDQKCRIIDSLIAGHQDIIEKEKEYKLSLITETVTHGLDAHVDTKDSGIDWIGKIPSYWSIRKLAWDYVSELGKMLDTKKITGRSLYSYIRNADVQWFQINTEALNEMDFDEDEIDRYSVLSGDLIVCEGGEIGRCAIVPASFPENIMYQKALHRVRARKPESGHLPFVSFVLYAMAKNDCLNTSPEKATIAHLPGENLAQLRLPAPPYNQQISISDYLNAKSTQIDEEIATHESLINKLTEYKKALIYEAVTGKKEV